MIEIINRENQQEEQEINLPKNIRQVGVPKGRHKIYMEDYVYNYLKNQAGRSYKCAAVLLGKSDVNKDMRYTFINGVIECSQAVFQFENICLDESFWEYISVEQKEHFPGSLVVGWFVGEQGGGIELSSAVESAHRKYFAGRDKVLMQMDVKEEEEIFYIYEQGYLQKREGYYLYFEKNPAMQEYMVRKKEESLKQPPELKEEAESNFLKENIDEPLPELSGNEKIFVKSSFEEPLSEAEKALQNYRKMMIEKRGHKVERHNKRFLYAATSFFMIALCIVGITTINNYHKMKQMENVLYVMQESKEDTVKKEKESDLIVESIASEVKTLDEQKKEKKKEQKEENEAQAKERKADKQEAKSKEREEIKQEEQPKTEQSKEEQEDDAQKSKETQAPAETRCYIVRTGDTLESICRKFYQDKSMMEALCQINGIENGNQIQAGQKLILP